MTSILPLEIEEIIINIVAEDDEGHSALKACSLVCWAFAHICRRHIFRSIDFSYERRQGHASDGLAQLLAKSPEIADYIWQLKFGILESDFSSSNPIGNSLKLISNLVFLEVNHWRGPSLYDWTNNPMRSTLLHLLHLPTLTYLTLVWIDKFVVSDLIPCINLKYLNLRHLSFLSTSTRPPEILPEHPVQLDELVVLSHGHDAITDLCTTRRPDGKSIIDFRSLSKVTIEIEAYGEVIIADMLFSRCEKLSQVDFSYKLAESMMPSLANMLRPTMRTLKHIVIEEHGSPLFELPSEFEGMRIKNIIETITIRTGRTIYSNRLHDWSSRFDELLTSSGWVSLERFSLEIRIATFNEKELEVPLRKMLRSQFPRLCSSQSVSLSIKFLPQSSLGVTVI